MNKTLNQIAEEILIRAADVVGTQNGKNPAKIIFLWNDAESASPSFKEILKSAHEYAKEDVDCYCALAETDPAELYEMVNTAAVTQNEICRKNYFNSLIHETCCEIEGAHFHVIGQIDAKPALREVMTYKQEKLRLFTPTVRFEGKDGMFQKLRLVFWGDSAVNAYRNFALNDIISVNGSRNRQHGSAYINHTVREASMFAEAAALAYNPTEDLHVSNTHGESTANYSMKIWGRRGHYRRRNGKIHYVGPAVCHRHSLMPQSTVA